MNTSMKAIFVTAIALAANAATASTLANTATVFLSADPGSYVGGGLGAPDVTWVHGVDGIFSAGPNYSDYKTGVNIAYHGTDYWDFQFSAPSYDPVTNTNVGQLLQIGTYTGAQRFPFNSPTKPGISISGAGRGNNTQTGWFNVLDIAYDDAGNLSTFAVDFKQFDEAGAEGLYGSLRYNSAIAIHAVPEAGSFGMMLLGLAMGAGALRRRAG
jgi:hypothetical protein